MLQTASVMSALWDLLHTALSFCGCFCLEEEFWVARRGDAGGATALRCPSGRLVRPRQQAYQDIEEMLLPQAEASHVGSDDGGDNERPASALGHAGSSSSEGGVARLGRRLQSVRGGGRVGQGACQQPPRV